MTYSKLLLFALFLILIAGLFVSPGYTKSLAYIKNYTAQEIYPDGDSYKEMGGGVPVTAVYKGDVLVGYVYTTTDLTPAVGYSGKPIKTLIGIDLQGTIIGAKIVEHHEPILLAGIPMSVLEDFVTQHVGLNVYKKKSGIRRAVASDVDLVSGATVTAMVVNDSVMRSGRKMLAAMKAGDLQVKKEEKVTLKEDVYQQKSWKELIEEGAIRKRTLSHEEVNQAFVDMGGPAEDIYGEYNRDDGGKDFIDLYTGLITPSSIGRSLLGEDEYRWLTDVKLEEGEHAIIVAANGAFSFRGSGFVRGGIFDRILLVQGENSFRFRDRDYKRIGDFVQEDAPEFNEIGAFVIRKSEFEDGNFDPAKPWRLELLVSRHVGSIEKIFTTFSLNYELPENYIARPSQAESVDEYVEEETPLWQRIWHDRILDITILSIALFLLTILFFVQDYLVHYPLLLDRIRLGFLFFALFWIGGYAQAQLSVVNALTFINSLLTGFSWEFFLLDPMIFILWSAVAISLLFWGRGVFCGWLCPFGALQEFISRVAKLVGIKQLKIPFYIHERLWTIKYMIFLGLLALSLSSMAMAELAAEVEPFKTVILLHFDREWYFVLYAGLLLGIGLFNERFFCRYLCPLGAALAIPANNRLFRWLKRRKECGSECGRCARRCMVQAIHDNGEINPNECLYCLGCQVIYYDEKTCLPLIQRRVKRETRINDAAKKAHKVKLKTQIKETK